MTVTPEAPARPLRVVELRAENFQGLRAVQIRPDEHFVPVSGANGAGKSSLLNLLFATIAGGAASRQIPMPVRKGQARAEGRVDLGELIVERVWKEGDSPAGTVKVTAKDGSKLSSPQQVLDKLMGKLAFDPLAFTRLGDADQVAALLDVVRLPFDPAKLAAERKAMFEKRTDVNRDVRRLEGELANKPTPPPGTPLEKVSLTALADEHAAATRAHAGHQGLIRDAEDLARTVQRLTGEEEAVVAEIERLQQKLGLTRSLLSTTKGRVLDAQARIRQSADRLPDVHAVSARLNVAEQTNNLVQLAQDRAALAELAAERQRDADALTRDIADLDARRERALAQTDMPVDGLSLSDDGVTYRGIPLRLCSGAEQLRVSVGIAMAANPTLGVIRVTDGALLDENGMRILEEMARDRDVQIWVERVDTSGEVGIVISDGMVFAINGQPETAATR